MRKPFFRFEIAPEAVGVNAGVRTAATRNRDGTGIEQLRGGFFHPLLDCVRVGLSLPAVIGGAVVF